MMDDRAPRSVTLRPMNQPEYDAASERRSVESIRELSAFMTEDEARQRVQAGTAQFLPKGRDTDGHFLVVAENEAGEVVGDLWLGPDPRNASGTESSSWIYDIYVDQQFRRQGYGSSILRAVENLVRQHHKARVGLNVVGSNEAAIALYRKNGFMVSSIFMDKHID